MGPHMLGLVAVLRHPPHPHLPAAAGLPGARSRWHQLTALHGHYHHHYHHHHHRPHQQDHMGHCAAGSAADCNVDYVADYAAELDLLELVRRQEGPVQRAAYQAEQPVHTHAHLGTKIPT